MSRKPPLDIAETDGLAPAPRQIDVWRAELSQASEVLSSLYERLDADEKCRAERFHFDRHRRRFIVARGALRGILADYADDAPGNLRFRYGPKGKPALADECGVGLQFNLSHSDELALVAVTRTAPVGIDVERSRNVPDALAIARRFFTRHEVDWIRGHDAEAQSRAFLTLWTRKEAYIKAIGDGLSIPINRVDVWNSDAGSGLVRGPDLDVVGDGAWRFHDLEAGAEFRAALVAPDGPVTIRSADWSFSPTRGD